MSNWNKRVQWFHVGATREFVRSKIHVANNGYGHNYRAINGRPFLSKSKWERILKRPPNPQTRISARVVNEFLTYYNLDFEEFLAFHNTWVDNYYKHPHEVFVQD